MGADLGERRISAYSEPPSNARKPTDSKTLLGQVMTPDWLADRMINRLNELTKDFETTAILDPCIGKAAFQMAAERNRVSVKFHCYDIDSEMIDSSKQLISTCNHISAEYQVMDYLTAVIDSLDHNAVISNPPYVRHEWIKNRSDLTELFSERFDLNIPGTSNLYVYFIVKMIEELPDGGKFCFLVYD